MSERDLGNTSTRSDASKRILMHSQSLRNLSFSSGRDEIDDKEIRGIILPWSKRYKIWWGLTVVCSIFTIFTETFQISFGKAGMDNNEDASSIIEFTLISIFVADIVVNFFLAFRDENDVLVYDRKLIAKHYLKYLFWIDFIGVFPFYVVALACAGQFGKESTSSEYLALFRLTKMVRLHRVQQLFEVLQYNSSISLMWLTLIRNLSAALIWSHVSACMIFFIARQYNFDPENTWIGGVIQDLTSAEQYITSLYWSIVTFTSVGYGDFSPVNPAEKIWGIIYMLLNIIISSWIIGTITLLIVKQDEKTGDYRDSMKVLDQYTSMHDFERSLSKGLKNQLKLNFKNSEVSDENVLRQFPTAVRRKVLRKLYLRSLMKADLMRDTREQFVDTFLVACKVEIFGPGDEIVQRGSICTDLYFLLEGIVAIQPSGDRTIGENDNRSDTGTSIADSDIGLGVVGGKDLQAGDFINQIGFFTQSPQVNTIRTKTVCKTLTMSLQTYKSVAEDNPDSVAKLLKNLLVQVRLSESKMKTMSSQRNSFDNQNDEPDMTENSYHADVDRTTADAHTEFARGAIEDLIKMHMEKQKDDNTTRFLFAASRCDTSMISQMCHQGFDPNCADYDSRSALMIASMKGHTDAVSLLLRCGANPNIVDVHGASALYEAVKNGHEETMEVLMDHLGSLAMKEELAASTLCQAVFDNDMSLLSRLLKAGIQVNAADYDKRTAAHIAAAEGNLDALKLLHDFGADFTVSDRWNNTLEIEATRSNISEVLEYLCSLKGMNVVESFGTETVPPIATEMEEIS
jgi:ankyrin repeat protein